jgi:hypothetical protein
MIFHTFDVMHLFFTRQLSAVKIATISVAAFTTLSLTTR